MLHALQPTTIYHDIDQGRWSCGVLVIRAPAWQHHPHQGYGGCWYLQSI